MVEVITEPFGRAAIKAGPEGRLRQRHAAALRHPLVVVRDAGNHVDVGINVVHGWLLSDTLSHSSLSEHSVAEASRTCMIATSPPNGLPERLCHADLTTLSKTP